MDDAQLRSISAELGAVKDTAAGPNARLIPGLIGVRA